MRHRQIGNFALSMEQHPIVNRLYCGTNHNSRRRNESLFAILSVQISSRLLFFRLGSKAFINRFVSFPLFRKLHCKRIGGFLFLSSIYSVRRLSVASPLFALPLCLFDFQYPSSSYANVTLIRSSHRRSGRAARFHFNANRPGRGYCSPERKQTEKMKGEVSFGRFSVAKVSPALVRTRQSARRE